jgi:hypothetical protein
LNYLARIPESQIQKCKEFLGSVPKTVRVIGIHIRFHWAGWFYSRGIQEAIDVVIPFCDKRSAEKPTVFALATDNMPLFQQLQKRRTFMALPVVRSKGIDHTSALTEFTMLMSST